MNKLIIIAYRVVDVIPENIGYRINKSRPTASVDFNNKWPEPPLPYQPKNNLNNTEKKVAEQANKDFLKSIGIGNKADVIA